MKKLIAVAAASAVTLTAVPAMAQDIKPELTIKPAAPGKVATATASKLTGSNYSIVWEDAAKQEVGKCSGLIPDQGTVNCDLTVPAAAGEAEYTAYLKDKDNLVVTKNAFKAIDGDSLVSSKIGIQGSSEGGAEEEAWMRPTIIALSVIGALIGLIGAVVPFLNR